MLVLAHHAAAARLVVDGVMAAQRQTRDGRDVIGPLFHRLGRCRQLWRDLVQRQAEQCCLRGRHRGRFEQVPGQWRRQAVVQQPDFVSLPVEVIQRIDGLQSLGLFVAHDQFGLVSAVRALRPVEACLPRATRLQSRFIPIEIGAAGFEDEAQRLAAILTVEHEAATGYADQRHQSRDAQIQRGHEARLPKARLTHAVKGLPLARAAILAQAHLEGFDMGVWGQQVVKTPARACLRVAAQRVGQLRQPAFQRARKSPVVWHGFVRRPLSGLALQREDEGCAMLAVQPHRAAAYAAEPAVARQLQRLPIQAASGAVAGRFDEVAVLPEDPDALFVGVLLAAHHCVVRKQQRPARRQRGEKATGHRSRQFGWTSCATSACSALVR